MSTSPRASQTRLPLSSSLSQHDQRPASTLVARQFSAVIEASDVFPSGKDCVLADATDGAVVVTLPAGSDEIVGLPFLAYKTDSSANAVSLACAGDDEFADASTSISTTAEGSSIGAMWDGLVWRPLSAAATAGPVAATTVAASTSVTVGDGTGSPSITLNKTDLGTDQIRFVSNTKVRGKVTLSSAEATSMSAFNTSEVLVGSISIDGVTGAITLVGTLVLTLADCREAADDAAAALLVPAVPVGGTYRTGSFIKIRAA